MVNTFRFNFLIEPLNEICPIRLDTANHIKDLVVSPFGSHPLRCDIHI